MSSLLAVKLRRDLRASWPRFALMVIALAVSLAIFGGVLMGWAAVGREAGGAYMSTEPASATIVLEKGVGIEKMAEIAAAAKQQPGVLEATGRTQFESVVEVNGQPRRTILQAFVAAPDDQMRMVKFDLRQEGKWPPPPGEIWIGGDGSLSLLGASVGDTLTVETPGGERAQLRVAGTVYDPSLAPSPQEQKGHGYLSTASLPATAGLLDQLKLQVAGPGQTEPSPDRGTVVSVADDVGEWLQREYGLIIAEIQVPKPYAHPHQWQADVLLVSLMAGAAAALLLATILVATMLNNLFTRQIPQIGIMKAIGARSARIARLYLAMTVLVAAAATLLALYPAVLIGRDRVEGLLGNLGIQPTSLAAPWWTYLAIVAIGLALPSLMALLPLIRASRTTVRAAIDHHGGGARPSAVTGVLAGLARLPGLDRGLIMALRNTVRRPARFWLSVGLLATAGTVFVAGMSLRSGTQALDEQRLAQRYWDVDVQLAEPANADTVGNAALEQLPDITRVEAFNRVQISISEQGRLPITNTYPDQGHGSINLNTIPVNRALPPPTVIEGRWLKPGETGAIVLNQPTHNKTVPSLGPGDTVRVFIDGQPTTWQIAGIIEEPDSAGGGAYTTPEALANATGKPQQISQLRIITTRSDEPTRLTVADSVEGTLTAAGIKVELAASESRGAAASSAHLGPVLSVLLYVAFPLGLVGGIGLASMMGANVLDRFREFGVMHAIGARPRAVRRIVVAEGLFLALTSCLMAALPTLGLTKLLGYGLGNTFGNTALPFRISALAVGIWVAMVIIGAAIATDAAANRASRITVREALAYI
ncbi:ABC transporter permease [Nonomuraea turcica]|uniref:ABC transporter permease n=1 Tax=Nonomuraea sp. G32 TaxID=3067274 RepID=UPI00273AB279|nr:ABC transporter permease [Nonomuraea sp. G32]MDP4501837.1 ABC transporter permease [Nonomuraea sp. G32]